MTDNIEECLEGVMLIDGAVGAAIVDWTTGRALGRAGVELDEEGVSDRVLAKVRVMHALVMIDPIEDILITLGSQYHLVRLARSYPSLILYVLLDRSKSNLALARMQLETAEETLVVGDALAGDPESAKEQGV